MNAGALEGKKLVQEIPFGAFPVSVSGLRHCADALEEALKDAHLEVNADYKLTHSIQTYDDGTTCIALTMPR